MAEYKIEELIIESLMETARLITDKSSDSRIIIPPYRIKEGKEESSRFSEQELKQVFLNRIEKDKSFFYSVETPSKYCYRFKDEEDPQVLFHGFIEGYQSSRIDVSLYNDEKNAVSHIEFKYGQCPVFPIQKDFLKLICESDEMDSNYYIQYLSPYNRGTEDAIFHKYANSLKNIRSVNENISDIDKKIENFDTRIEKVELFVMFVNSDSFDSTKIFRIPLGKLANLDLPEKDVGDFLKNYKVR